MARLGWHGHNGPDVTQTSAGCTEDTWRLIEVADELVTFEDTVRFDSDGAGFTSRSTL